MRAIVDDAPRHVHNLQTAERRRLRVHLVEHNAKRPHVRLGRERRHALVSVELFRRHPRKRVERLLSLPRKCRGAWPKTTATSAFAAGGTSSGEAEEDTARTGRNPLSLLTAILPASTFPVIAAITKTRIFFNF